MSGRDGDGHRAQHGAPALKKKTWHGSVTHAHALNALLIGSFGGGEGPE